MDEKQIKRCGLATSIQEFFSLTEFNFLKELTSFLEDAGPDQVAAWKDCYQVLQQALFPFKHEKWPIIFEYALPREGGRRPDVLLLLPGQVVVLEFKMRGVPLSSDWEQLSSYVRDLSNYHETVIKHSLTVRGLLVLTSVNEPRCEGVEKRELYMASGTGLTTFLAVSSKKARGVLLDENDFLSADYDRLPTIIEAARSIMNDQPLPNIRKVNNTNIPHVLKTIQKIAAEAQETKSFHLVLLTGVPGAGKTLIGLQCSHSMNDSIYLSGNGPLVDVLQDALGNKTFVQALRTYKKDYVDYRRVPSEHVIIFDEAQRAWDARKMKASYSEPDLIMEMAQKEKEWAVVIGLVGEGQEIHVGEEAGLSLWDQAIRSGSWVVHSHDVLDGLFPNAQHHVLHQHLNLNESLRSHLASDLHQWVHQLLVGDITDLPEKTKKLTKDRYTLYVTRNLDAAKRFLRERYEDTDKQVGLVASSRRKYGGAQLPYDFIQGLPEQGRYQAKSHILYFNRQESDCFSSKLHYAATEFDTQGLELDLAVVCWGYDLRWNGYEWVNYFKSPTLNDPKQLRLNSYRVLLTRGRDGVILYIPDVPILDDTFALLKELEIEELQIYLNNGEKTFY